MRRAGHDHTLPLGPLMRWVVLVFLAGLLGLCFVHMKHKLKVDGDRCRDLEQSVADLDEKLKVADNEIMRLTSRPALERRREEGFIRMIEVQANRMVRLRLSETQSAPIASAREVAP
ncbi:MAG: hypothetical protein FGM15_01705 [Chthoniobacterales bacterium]|nr:hypothetical protein [Chthoniobacterales bacterium]